MDGPFSGRVALITGASGGIGQALAHRLAAAGAVLGLAYGANGQAAEALAAEITAAGGRAIAVGADLRRAEAPGQLVRAASQALGPVDVLVSNAGLSRVQPLDDVTAAQFDEMLAVNLRAPFLLAQSAVPAMRGTTIRPDPVHLLGRRVHRRHRRPALCGVQGRAARADPLPGLPARRARNHGQCASPSAGRRDRDAAQRPRPRRIGRPQPPLPGSTCNP